jgi:hypothetical protein
MSETNPIDDYYKITSRASFTSSGKIDTDPEFVQDVDAAWEAIDQYRNHPPGTPPSDATVQALMRAINTLNTYLASHGPIDKSTDPKAAAIVNLLNQPLSPHGDDTLASICQDYGTANNATTVHWFEQFTSGSDPFSNLYSAFSSIGSQRSDQNNTTVKADFDALQSDLSLYNNLISQNPPPSEQQIEHALQRLMADVKNLHDDAINSNPPVSDGYLKTILTLVDTPISTAPGSPTLLQLASASTLDFTAIKNAMSALGETGKSGGDLTKLLIETKKYEYPSN